MKNILICGATSAIATAAARLWAERGDCLFLVGRNQERLQLLASDLKVRGAPQVWCEVLDANAFGKHEALLEQAFSVLQRVDVALIAHGALGDQRQAESDFPAALEVLNTNAISVISLLTSLARRLEAQQSGTIAVLGSVAGDRGRPSNYVYGTAKGAVAIYLQGLRARLHKSGVRVLTVKPGFVDSPMTAGFKKGILWSSPQRIAKGILRGIDRRRDVVYLPWFWRPILLAVRMIPERIFKKLRT